MSEHCHPPRSLEPEGAPVHTKLLVDWRSIHNHDIPQGRNEGNGNNEVKFSSVDGTAFHVQ